jgi:uncharacterized protein (TIGR00251 family)
MLLQVKVTPNASKNEILGWEGSLLRIKIRGAPEKGKVNEALIEFLANELNIAKSRIELLSGHTSRFKRLKIEGIEKFELPKF